MGKKKISIKNKLIFSFIAVTIITLIISGSLIDREIRRQTKLDYSRALEKELTQIGIGIENYLKLIQENTEMLADTKLLREVGNEITSYVDLSDPSGKIKMKPMFNSVMEQQVYFFMKNYVRTHPEIEVVALGVESNGGYVQYPASDRFNHYDPRVREWYQLAMQNPGKAVFTDVYQSSSGAQNIVALSSVQGSNGETMGVVTMNLNLRALTENIGKLSLGENGYLILTDKKGTILSNTKDSKTISQKIDTLQIPFLEEIIATETARDVLMPDGVSYSVDSTTMTDELGLGWSFITFVETSEYRITANKIGMISILSYLLLAIIGSLVMILIANKMVGPLGEISRHLTEIGEGNFKSELNWKHLSGKDEIGEIARAANKMKHSLQKLLEHVNHIARHDYLTNLPNRRFFIDKLTEELTAKRPGAVFLLDINNFKMVNDTMGHFIGDALLIEIAKRLQEVADEAIFVSRMGGDEFLVLIMDCDEPSKIEHYAISMNRVCEKTFSILEKEIFVSYSMGITMFPEDSDNIDQILMNADTAMYKAKHGGRENYVFYQDEMKEEIQEKLEVEAILRQALKQDWFYLLYQPQVDAVTGLIDGFEALLRIRDVTLSPGIFIPIAEETGLIIPIGRVIIEKAVKQIADWKEKGLTGKSVAINFSSAQLKDTGFIDFMNKTLHQYEISPALLEIEITEGILLKKNEDTMQFLQQLKQSGYCIALDDFGTGYSSLNYLTFMPVDKIKFDKSLIDKFLSHENTDVIKRLISLIHSLDFAVVAEGVEDWDSYLNLKQNKCDVIQGYLFSRPVPAEEIEQLYHQNLIEQREDKISNL